MIVVQNSYLVLFLSLMAPPITGIYFGFVQKFSFELVNCLGDQDITKNTPDKYANMVSILINKAQSENRDW